MELSVNLGPDTYPIYIENGILPQTGSYIRKFFTGKKIMIISDDHVFPLYGKTVLDSLKDYECHSLVLPHGEPTKSFQTLPQIYSAMLDARLTRSVTLPVSLLPVFSGASGWFRSRLPFLPR